MESNRRPSLARSTPPCAKNGTVQHVKRRRFLTNLLSTLAHWRARVFGSSVSAHGAVTRTNVCRLTKPCVSLRNKCFHGGGWERGEDANLLTAKTFLDRRESRRSVKCAWQVLAPFGVGLAVMPPVQRTMSDLRSRAEGKKWKSAVYITVIVALDKCELHHCKCWRFLLWTNCCGMCN